ncbi:hypothetical protein [Bacillus nakamurai]|uniref:hypothetical protein n=1 Tax=Bacillus nakamurai TaxID=1793963 RepID=UPI0020C4C4B2|nr:hypothetical protein [Bacillus nakamurai]MCP6682287.1 hypothetical protein [Bacillus nakamurai]
MPYKYDLKIDLQEHFKLAIRKKLLDYGYSDVEKFPLDRMLYLFLNLQKRLISVQPRKIYISKEFKCLPQYTEVLKSIISRIKTGKDLSSHLSKTISYLNYDDHLLNDWGIHHLHLGEDLEKNTGFVKRTDPLLFVRFTNNEAYLLQIMPHGNWANEDLIQIINNNWPGTIKEFLIKGISSVSPALSEKDRKNLRRHGISTFVQLEENKIYYPLGGGYTSNGSSLKAHIQADQLLKKLRCVEMKIKENIAWYAKKIHKTTNYKGNEFIFLLEVGENILIYEVYSNYKIRIII